MPLSKIDSDSLNSGVPTRAQLPAGSVLQVVGASFPTFVSTTSSAELDTGINLSITPTSTTSKVVITVNMEVGKYGGSAYVRLWLYRNAANLIRFGGQLAYTGDSGSSGGTGATVYVDSPNTTSSVNYKVTWANPNNAGTSELNPSSSVSTITLMEIAA